MTTTDRIEAIFQDARYLQANTLVPARTGEEPERTPETGADLQELGTQNAGPTETITVESGSGFGGTLEEPTFTQR